MHYSQRKIIVRLGVFFDGTGNTRHGDAGQEVSNIARLYELYRDQAALQIQEEASEVSLKVYLEGIGAGAQGSLYGQATGRGCTGVLARVEQCPALILEQLRRLCSVNPGVKIQNLVFDLFGFSRGAAAARHFANDLLKGGESLLAKALPAGSAILAEGFSWRAQQDFSLNFIGLFDTVVGIVSPLEGDFSASNAKNPGLDLVVAPGTAHKVVHMVARDEYRYNFPLTGTDNEIVVPGAHSDIGGGYPLEQCETLLLSKPDSSLVGIGEPLERTPSYVRSRGLLEQRRSQWQAKGLDLELVHWVVEQPYHRKRDLRAERRVYAAVQGQRQVFGHLSLVYLRIMRELAVRDHVPFAAIDGQSQAFELPPELQVIAAKLQRHALGETSVPGLTDAEEALLARRYIHLSAHWQAVNEWRSSDLDAMFINRPAEGERRRIAGNDRYAICTVSGGVG